MDDTGTPGRGGWTRRDVVKLVAGAVGAAGIGPLTGARSASAAANPIQIENAQTGSYGWYKVFSNISQSGEVEGYASATSVAPGGTITFHVSTSPAATFRIEVYRLGHYGGRGSRLMASLPSGTTTLAGTPQPIPAPAAGSRSIECAWPAAASLTVPGDWVSGYYVAVFEVIAGPTAGLNNYYPFVVTAPASRPKVALVHAGATTWQAYNNWPGTARNGTSLYDHNSVAARASRVTFQRPYNTIGNQNVFEWESAFCQWLERRGLDVAYTTGIDTHLDPAVLSLYDLVIVNGHDEYWSASTRTGFDAALATGTNLAFMGANIGYWQIRMDGAHAFVCHKDATSDPVADLSQRTVRFRDLTPPRPEAALIGVQFEYGMPNGYRTYAIADESLGDPWFAGTSFAPGDSVTDVVGYEYDTVVPGVSPANLTTFFRYGGSPAELLPAGHCTRYVHPTGAVVFSTGTMQWPVRMTSDPRLERFTANAIDALLVPSGAPPNTAPTVTLTSPSDGATAQVGTPLALAATAMDVDGAVGRVEFLVDGAVVAQSTTSPFTATWTPTVSGAVTVAARAVDQAGATTVTPGVSVTVGAAPVGTEITLVGTASTGDNGRTPSAVLALPSGVLAGDVVVVALQTSNGTSAPPAPAGYTLVADHRPTRSWHPRLVLYTKVAAGGETSVTLTTGYVGKSAVALVYRNVDQVMPIGGVSTGSVDGSSITLPGVVAAASNTRLVAILGSQNHATPGTFAPPAGATMQASMSTLSWLGIAAVDETVGAGSSGTRRATFSASGAALSGLLFALRPAAGSAAPPPNASPTVSITAPTDGTVVTVGTPITITATAADDVAVARVEITAANTPVATLTTAPYTTTYTPTAAGPITISARAVDGQDRATTAAVTVTAQSAPPPPSGGITLLGTNQGGDNGRVKNLTMSLPAGIATGDLILVAVQSSTTSFPTPTGYTTVIDVVPTASWHPRISVHARVATGGETSVVVATGNSPKTGVVLVYRGVAAAGAVAATSWSSKDGNKVTIPAVAAPTAGTQLVVVLAAQNHASAANFTPPPGMTRRAGLETLAWNAVAVCDETVGSGTTGTRIATFATSAALSGVLLALRRG